MEAYTYSIMSWWMPIECREQLGGFLPGLQGNKSPLDKASPINSVVGVTPANGVQSSRYWPCSATGNIRLCCSTSYVSKKIPVNICDAIKHVNKFWLCVNT